MGSKFWSQSSLSGCLGVHALYQVMCDLAEYLQLIYSGMLSVLSPLHRFLKIVFTSI